MKSKHASDICYSKLKKYFWGELSGKDYEEVQAWLREPDNKFQLDQYLFMLWQEIDFSQAEIPIDQARMLDRIHHTINLYQRMPKSKPHSHKSSISMKKVFSQLTKAAAILLLPFLIYLTWEVFSQRMWLNTQHEIVYNEIICPLGARSHFELPDGTTGSLNNGSRLKYPTKFQGDLREVELMGEAFFDVKSNRQRPFLIQTHGLDVKVTGTQLNVYSYPEDAYQEFTVESGTIELLKEENNQEVTLAKMQSGQYAVYRDKAIQPEILVDKKHKKKGITKRVEPDDIEKLESQVSQIKSDERVIYESDKAMIEFENKENIQKYSSWKEGILVLRNDPMPILLKRIERWYHVEFNVLDEGINEYTYWATFEEESIDQVLELLSLTAPIEFRKYPRKKREDGQYKAQVIDVMLKD